MRSSRLSVVVGIISILAISTLTVLFPQLGGPRVWYAVGAVYVLTLVLGGGVRHWGTRSLDFQKTVGIAAVVVVALIPVISPLLVEWGNSRPSLLQYWSSAIALHFQRLIPVTFMFPLGAATTRRQQLGTVIIMLLPSIYELLNWFVLHPSRFDPLWTTPLTLVLSTGFWFLILVALGTPLFLLGRQLTRKNDPPQHSPLPRDSLESG